MKHPPAFIAFLLFANTFYRKLIYLIITWSIFFIMSLQSQSTIAFQNFETSGSNYNYTNTNGILQSGNSLSSDRPASAAFFVSNNNGFRVTNQTATIQFDNISGLNLFQSKKISLRLAAFSIASASNGLDAGDKVTLSISLNGGTSYSDELTVKGNGNASWHYSTGIGTATVNYDGNNTAAEFAPVGGGNRTSDGYSLLTINLPDSCTQVKFKITMNNDSNNEAWLIDDVLLTGCMPPTSITCPSNVTVNTDPLVCNRQINYNVSSNGAPNPIFNYSFSGSTSGSGSGTGSGSKFNAGITTVTITASNSCGITGCLFTITVIDLEVPLISCPTQVIYYKIKEECNNPVKSSINLGTATASDNCGIAFINNNAPNSFPDGTTTVIWTATDIHQNINSCIQNVSIISICGPPFQVLSTGITDSMAIVKWKPNSCSSAYQLRIRKEISPAIWGGWSEWKNIVGKSDYLFSGLESNAFYHYQIRGMCGITYSYTVNDWFYTRIP